MNRPTPDQHAELAPAHVRDGRQQRTEDPHDVPARQGDRERDDIHAQAAREHRQERIHHPVHGVEHDPQQRDDDQLASGLHAWTASPGMAPAMPPNSNSPRLPFSRPGFTETTQYINAPLRFMRYHRLGCTKKESLHEQNMEMDTWNSGCVDRRGFDRRRGLHVEEQRLPHDGARRCARVLRTDRAAECARSAAQTIEEFRTLSHGRNGVGACR